TVRGPGTDARRRARSPPEARRLRRRRRPHRQRRLPRHGRRPPGRVQALSHPGRPGNQAAPDRRASVVWVSGRESAATALRARELAIDEVIQDPSARKLPLFEALRERRGLAWEECAFVGDDLADLPLLTRVGLPIAVANGVAEVKAAARLVTTVPGGHGAVREVAELILKARGEWQGLLTKYFLERGDVPHGAQRTR